MYGIKEGFYGRYIGVLCFLNCLLHERGLNNPMIYN